MMIKISKPIRVAVFLALGWAGNLAWTRPYQAESFQFVQPDNTLVDVLVWGDEFHQDVESPEGYTLIRDSQSGWICYAELSPDGAEYVSTGIPYTPGKSAGKTNKLAGLQKKLRITKASIQRKRAEKRRALQVENLQPGYRPEPALAKKSAVAASADTVYGLTLLVNFKDVKSPFTHQELNNLFNKKGYGTFGSVLDYFEAVSNKKFTYINRVSKYLTLSKEKSYYDQPRGIKYIVEFIDESMKLLEKSKFDFKSVSISGKHFVAVNFLYAGIPRQGWGFGLWPHMGGYQGKYQVDGLRIGSYQIANIGNNPNISTIIHESGHLLFGWPDLYPYDYSSNGVGRYCVMCSNTPNPQFPNPYLRHKEGWIDIMDISKAARGSVFNIMSNSHSAYLYSGMYHGSKREMYYIEARQKKGRHADLPDEGLLIWHIDEDGNNKTGKRFLVAVEQADGRFDLENRRGGGGGDLFHAGYKNQFNDKTSPGAKWHNGGNSGLDIANISEVSERMFFTIGAKVPSYIQIFNPNSATLWEQNKNYKIKWYDNIDETVDIELWQNGARHSVIKSALSSTKDSYMSYDWRIPGELLGSGYSIRIVQNGDGISENSNGGFNILPEYRVVSFPYLENFDAFVVGNKLINHWEQSEDDDFDWTIMNGATPSKSHPNGGGTGPDDDHTVDNGPSSGNYIYAEASNPNNPNKKSALFSPVFDLTMVKDPELSFWVHMYSTDGNMGKLEMDISVDGEWSEGVIKLTGDHGDKWFRQTVDFAPYVGERVQVRFRSLTGREYDGDICIDDFEILGIPKVVNIAEKAGERPTSILKVGGYLLLQNITGIVHIYALSGKQMLRVDAGKIQRIDISNLSNGTYFARANSRMFKFVK